MQQRMNVDSAPARSEERCTSFSERWAMYNPYFEEASCASRHIFAKARANLLVGFSLGKLECVNENFWITRCLPSLPATQITNDAPSSL
jgi:hypothetical protein